ncbi:twin-arginine translocase TatA/TatE family subunit [Geodermatophilus nigrescens]|uniref:Sec-independent protein translocase protein TatB n=1 Tax=Geodermatophilus nigrescens TaxID=1070870 RepID=A0A1M5ERI5_9ACTN|nr:twin-arginine translocase TatA/TatE family subunit [Geodermatophilus nigrescens]SHF81731.1 sec-independent protein translocase protein TatB [Geodermatophilus nigrescens]
MFDSIGWGEIVVLALAALFIFGPERLPTLARDAAAGLKKARTALTGVRAQVDESLGEDLAGLRDLDLRKYHPKTFIRAQLFEDDDHAAPPVRRGSAGAAGATAASLVKPAVVDRTVPPPFDVDAT